jgi:hypothetical protein
LPARMAMMNCASATNKTSSCRMSKSDHLNSTALRSANLATANIGRYVRRLAWITAHSPPRDPSLSRKKSRHV